VPEKAGNYEDFTLVCQSRPAQAVGLSGFDHLLTSCMIVGFEKGPYKKPYDPKTH